MARRSDGQAQRTPRRRLLLVAVLVVVMAVDQAGKWWGWRHSSSAQLNAGGDILVGPTVSAWYAAPLPGTVLDVVGAAVLGYVLRAILCCCQPAAIQVSGTLAVAGWGSNLLDRLGMHHLSAPGSARGAVDFIQIGADVYNLADFVIVAGTLLFLTALTARYVTSGPAGQCQAGSTYAERVFAREPLSPE